MSTPVVTDETTLSDLFPGKFLRGVDLKGKTLKVKISAVKQSEPLGKDMEIKPLVEWADGLIKPMILNVTNGRTLAGKFGVEVKGWIGKDITLYPVEMEVAGEPVTAIRIKVE